MIDDRLRNKWERDRRKQSFAAVEGHPQLALLETWIEAWWNTWESRTPTEDEPNWPDGAAEALRSSRPCDDELSQEIERWLLSRRDAPPDANAALLILRVVGRATAIRDASLERFDRAARLAMTSNWGHEFLDGLARSVHEANRPQWIAALSKFPVTLEEWCGPRVQSSADELEGLREHEARRLAAGEQSELWDVPEPRGLEPSEELVFRIRGLFLLSPANALAALERLPSVGLRRIYLFFLSIGDDFDSILRALAAAPALWIDEQWVGHSIAPAIITAALKYLSRLVSAVVDPLRPGIADPEALEQLNTTELPDKFRRLTDTIFARSDGRWLALDCLAFLLRKTSWSQNSDRTRIEQSLLSSLIDAMPSTGLRPRDVRRFARRRLPVNARWERRAAFASAAGFTVESPRNALDAWSDFTAMLGSAEDDDLLGSVHSYLVGTPLLAGLGRALARTAAPIESWNAMWRELYVKRERSRFSSLSVKGLLPSAYLALVGLAALHNLIPSDMNAAQALWDDVSRCLRLLACAPQEHIGFRMDEVLAIPWAFAKNLFADSWHSRLPSAKDVLATKPVACLLSANFLVMNGVSATDVIKRMRDEACDLVELVGQEVQWLEAKGFGTVVDQIDLAVLLGQLLARSRAT